MTSEFNADIITPGDEPMQEIGGLGSGHFRFYRMRRYGVLHFVKKIAPEFAGDTVTEQSLRKEFQLGYGLDHPSLVRYLDFDGESIYEEYVDGLTLSEMLRSDDTRLKDAAFLASTCRQLLEGVAYLHAHGIAHLDLKPENVMVTRLGNNVKIIDLGCAVSGSFDSTPGSTAGYSAPEQSGGSPDHLTDIYLVGKIMDELAGRGGKSKYWRRFVAKATARIPSRRFASCSEAIGAIPCKRRKGWLVPAFLLLAAVVAAILVILWMLSPDPAMEMVTDALNSVAVTDTVTITPETNERKDDGQTEEAPKVVPERRQTMGGSGEVGLQKQVAKEVEAIFERNVGSQLRTWQMDSTGRVPAERTREYMQLLGRSYDMAVAYGERFAGTHPDRQLLIEATIRQTSEAIVARYHKKYYY